MNELVTRIAMGLSFDDVNFKESKLNPVEIIAPKIELILNDLLEFKKEKNNSSSIDKFVVETSDFGNSLYIALFLK